MDDMIVFASNYLSHHQLPFALAMTKKTHGDFVFVATEVFDDERLAMGWPDLNMHNFVLRAYESEENRQKAQELCNACDVLIYGSAPDDYFIPRVRQKKLTFRYSERFFKEPFTWRNTLHRVGSMCKHLIPYQNKNHFLLCASAYTAADVNLFGCYRNCCYKWGYFPEVKRYDDVDELMSTKRKNTLLWAGRFLDWKHPEAAVQVAQRLQRDGYDFDLTMIGTGPMEEEIRRQVEALGLSDKVHLTGSMSPEEVRRHMEQAEIFLFTSDRNEGWGAVLNESMNSGCAVVASRAIGAAPFLIQNGENGLIYEDGNLEDLYSHVKGLLDAPARRQAMGRAAYETMTTLWNADVAAARFLQLAERLNKGEMVESLFVDGPCSKAYVIK